MITYQSIDPNELFDSVICEYDYELVPIIISYCVENKANTVLSSIFEAVKFRLNFVVQQEKFHTLLNTLVLKINLIINIISTFITSSQTEKIVLNFLDFNSNQKRSILVIQCVTSGRSLNQPIRTLQITHDSDKH